MLKSIIVNRINSAIKVKNIYRYNGFTLMELLIVISVLTILFMIALPGYQSFIRSNKMKAASLVVLKDASFMEKWYGIYGKYSAPGKKWPTLPYPVAPESDVDATLYKIELTPIGTADDNSYKLRATPLCKTIVAEDGCICVDQDHNVRLNANNSCSNDGNTKCPCVSQIN